MGYPRGPWGVPLGVPQTPQRVPRADPTQPCGVPPGVAHARGYPPRTLPCVVPYPAGYPFWGYPQKGPLGHREGNLKKKKKTFTVLCGDIAALNEEERCVAFMGKGGSGRVMRGRRVCFILQFSSLSLSPPTPSVKKVITMCFVMIIFLNSISDSLF